MKHTAVKRRRTDPVAGHMVWLICPICGAPHWLRAGRTGRCPRRNGTPFVITER